MRHRTRANESLVPEIVMILDFRKKEIEEVFRTPIVQQTAFWSEVKRRMGISSIACNFRVPGSEINGYGSDGGNVTSDVLVVLGRLTGTTQLPMFLTVRSLIPWTSSGVYSWRSSQSACVHNSRVIA